MFEKVNPFHPDKVADRIAGAITDLAYDIAGGPDSNPKIATEVLIGHGCGQIIIETSVPEAPLVAGLPGIMKRICPDIKPEFTNVRIVQQDPHLAANQDGHIRCGDNGIFRGCRDTKEQQQLTRLVKNITDLYPYDGKYVLDTTNSDTLICCQSNVTKSELFRCLQREMLNMDRKKMPLTIINPLGDWTGGLDVDSGATNRKLGSDMGDAVTGGGLHGKDLSKADVSINIACWLLAEWEGKVEARVAIGDDKVVFHCGEGNTYKQRIEPYADVVKMARGFIYSIGGFEKFAEWGLIRPI